MQLDEKAAEKAEYKGNLEISNTKKDPEDQANNKDKPQP